MKRMLSRTLPLLLALCLALSLTVPAAAAVSYAPDVTSEMSDPDYWAALCDDPDRVLMTQEEIKAQNALSVTVPSDMLNDLKNAADTFDGLARNKALVPSAEADAKYYLGWTYGPDGEKADEAYYQAMIDNCVDPNAKAEQSVRYGIAVNRTNLTAFPSENPIWDDPTDPDFNYQYLVSVRVNEPVLLYTTSADGKFYLAKNSCCSGWIPAEDVAICQDKTEWLNAWDIPDDEVLVVCTGSLYTAASNFDPVLSKKLLTLGTKLRSVDPATVDGLVNNRTPFHNYIVEMPIREEDGSYSKKLALIPETALVSEGYLPMTQRNILTIALRTLGDPYGWGGMMENEDCSGLVRLIYECFGLSVARNRNWQYEMPVAKVNLDYTCTEEKELFLDALPTGAALCFNGHEMLYLGAAEGNYYVLSSTSNIMNLSGTGKQQRVRDVFICSLDLLRANGRTWMQDTNRAFLLSSGEAVSTAVPLPALQWYHDSVATCLKNGWLTSDSKGYFRPDENATRAEFVEAMWRLAGKPESETELTFTDVTAEDTFAPAVRWAVQEGIFTGYSEEKFGPADPLTREQLVTVLCRYAGHEGMETAAQNANTLDTYTDGGKVSAYAKDAMIWACEKGVLNGDNGRLKPKTSCTRAELSAILTRFDGLEKPEVGQDTQTATEPGA